MASCIPKHWTGGAVCRKPTGTRSRVGPTEVATPSALTPRSRAAAPTAWGPWSRWPWLLLCPAWWRERCEAGPKSPGPAGWLGVHLLKVSSHLPHPRLRRTQCRCHRVPGTLERGHHRSAADFVGPRTSWAGAAPQGGLASSTLGPSRGRTDGVLEQVRELAVPVGHVATAR